MKILFYRKESIAGKESARGKNMDPKKGEKMVRKWPRARAIGFI